MLLATVLSAFFWAWQVYDREILPYVTPSPLAHTAASETIRLDDPAAVRRYQSVLDHLGQAATYRQAKRQDWADAALERALALDPKNGEALALKARWQVEPAPTLTPDEIQSRQRAVRVMDLLGAAASFVTAGDPAQAILHLQEALRLDPENATARAALHRLTASD